MLPVLLVCCSTPQRMCVGEGACGAQGQCVAGRCLAKGAAADVETARRLLYEPVEVAYVRRGESAGVPAIATLGGSDGAVALLRFFVPLPPEARVVEAYILFERAAEVDVDPAPVALRAVRVLDPWDGRSVSWARRPRTEGTGSPVTLVRPASGPWVRLDARALVRRWRDRGDSEQGVAIVAEANGPPGASGVALALASGGAAAGPRLELYVK